MNLTSGISLAPLQVEINTDLAGFKSDMSRAQAIGVQGADNISASLSKAARVGDSISGLGSKLTMGLTLPLAGLSLAIGKIGMDYESQMSRVKAISGATGAEFEKLDKQAIDLGASTAFSAKEAALGMENLASAGFNVNEIMEAMPGMMDLAASSGEDLASSADIAASTLRGFGLEASQAAHVADVLAKNSSATNAAVADTGEAMKYIAPVAHSMGLSLEEVTASIGIMANAGIKGSAAGTTLRTSLSRLADPSSEAAEAMKKLSFTAFDGSGRLLSLKDIIGNLKVATKDLTMQQKQQAISTIFGTEAMSGMLTLVDAGPEQLAQLTDSLKNSDGAAKEMAETMQDNAKSSVEQMIGSLETAAIKIEKSIAPTVIKIANKVGELADKFSNLSENQQENILKWAAIAMAAGPVLKLFGGGISTVATLGTKLISLSSTLKGASVATSALGSASSVAGGATGVGSLVGGLGSLVASAGPVILAVGAVAGVLYTVHENNEYMRTSLNATTEDLSLLQKAFNKMDGGVIKSQEEMEKLGLKYHEWTSNVAPDTIESIDNTAEAWQKLNFEIDRLKINKITLNQENVSNLQNQTDNICKGIIEEIKANQTASQKELSEYFNVDGALDSYEKTVLGFFGKNTESQITLVTEFKNKINAIYQKAADDHRTITEEEWKAIEDLEKKMNQAKIDALSTNNEEYQELQANFNVKMRNLDLQGASELMQEKSTKRDEDIAQLQEYYDTKIELLSMNLADMNTQERIAAEEQIRKLKQDKDAKIGVENDTYNGYLKTIEEKYPEIYNRIDWHTGKILEIPEREARERVANSLTMFDGIGDITESGMQRLYNTQTKSYEDVYVMVDENTGKIIGTWNKTRAEIEGNSEEIRSQLGLIAQEHSNLEGVSRRDMEAIILSNDNYSASTKYTALQAAQALQGTGKEVNGLYTEIITLNGQPVQVQVNKDGTITNLNEIDTAAANAARDRHMTIWATYTDENGNPFTGSAKWSDGRGGYYANGQDYVPFDGYTARLHKGERVLTAKENEAYTEGKIKGNGFSGGLTINFNGTYGFNDKQDIDYFLNQAALKLKGVR